MLLSAAPTEMQAPKDRASCAHPPYSLGLAAGSVWLFPKVKTLEKMNVLNHLRTSRLPHSTAKNTFVERKLSRAASENDKNDEVSVSEVSVFINCNELLL